MKISLTIAALCILNSYVFTQDKPLNKSIRTVISENSAVSIKNDQYDPTFIQKKGERPEKNLHISNLSHINHQNNFQKDLFGLDLIQTTIASEDYYIKSHYVVTEQTGNTAGTIWVVAGIESNPSGNDKIGIYKYEQTGWVLKTYVYTFRFLSGDLDAEIIERYNGDKSLYITTSGTSQTPYGKKNVLLVALNLNDLSQGSITDLSWPGITNNEYYNPHITTDNGSDDTYPFLYLVASVDSITTDNKHVNAQKFAYIDNPWAVTSPNINYRSEILPVYWPNGGATETHFLYSDIAYVHIPSSLNRIIFTYSNVPDETKIWLSSCTITGANALFTGTIDRGTGKKIQNSAIAASGGLDQSQIMVAFEENYNNGGDIDIHSAKSNDGGITWEIATIDFSESSAMLGKLVSRRGVTNEYYLSYFSDIDSVMSIKSNSNTGYYWDVPIKVNDSYPSNPFYITSTGFTNTLGERLTVWGKFAQPLQLPVLLIGSFWPNLPTSLENETDLSINTYQLFQNYPNPFNPSTKISWQSPVSSHQTLKVYDVLGNEIATLLNEEKDRGVYSTNFDASGLASGIYFYRLQAEDFIQTNKMILIK